MILKNGDFNRWKVFLIWKINSWFCFIRPSAKKPNFRNAYSPLHSQTPSMTWNFKKPPNLSWSISKRYFYFRFCQQDWIVLNPRLFYLMGLRVANWYGTSGSIDWCFVRIQCFFFLKCSTVLCQGICLQTRNFCHEVFTFLQQYVPIYYACHKLNLKFEECLCQSNFDICHHKSVSSIPAC